MSCAGEKKNRDCNRLLRNLPITELLSEPKAQIQWAPPGTWNLEKLQFELKYFGKNALKVNKSMINQLNRNFTRTTYPQRKFQYSNNIFFSGWRNCNKFKRIWAVSTTSQCQLSTNPLSSLPIFPLALSDFTHFLFHPQNISPFSFL